MAKKVNNPISTIYKGINDNSKIIKAHLNDVVSYDLQDPKGLIAAKNQANYIKDKILGIIKLIGESQKLFDKESRGELSAPALRTTVRRTVKKK